MPVNIGVNIQRSPNRINQQLRESGVEGKFPKLLLDFKDQYYLASGGSKTLANAVTHARSGNAVMTDGYGPELVTNGGFDSDSDWTLGTGWSIADGVASHTGSATGLTQSGLTVGKTYAIEFDILNYRSNTLNVYVGTAFQGGFSGNGRKLAIVTATGNGNLQFYGGLEASIDNVSVREMPVLKWAPHNLLTYSEEFDNDTNISNQSVTMTGNAGVAPDGTSTADRLVGTGGWFRQRNFTHTVGMVLTTNMWVKSNTGSNQTFRIYGDNSETSADLTATNEWQLFSHEYTVSTGGTTGDGITRDTSNTDADLLVWGHHTYRSDLGGMVDNPERGDSYVPTTSSAKYLPRIGHHVYNGSAWVNEGLLAESEARTNLVVQSHDFSTSWSKINISLTSDDAVGPDGLESADLLVANTTNSQHRVDLTPTSSAGTQTFSVYLKPNGYSNAWLRIGTSGSGFNLTDGSTFTTTGGITTTAQEVGNGWYRCSVTTTSASANDTVRINVLGSSSAADFAGDGTSGIYIYGAMLEQAATPSSLIPTSGSSVTRAAETFTIPSANLPWPSPVYIGSQIIANGDFSSSSDWTLHSSWAIANGVATHTAGSGGQISQAYSFTSGKVYSIKYEVTGQTAGTINARLSSASGLVADAIIGESRTADGSYEDILVADSTSAYVGLFANGTFDGSVDNVSVREINPLSVSIAMDGRVSFADENTSQQHYLVNWFDDTSNMIRTWIDTTQGTGAFDFRQSEGGTTDIVTSGTDTLAPDILVPYSIAQRHGSTFLNGALDGVSLTEDTTPTALPDLSATDLNIAYDYMGTISVFRVWDRDIGDTGLVEATSPSLEPSLSLTFEGVGTNSFVVSDWS